MDKVHDAGTPLMMLVIWLLLAAALGGLVLSPPRVAREPALLSDPLVPNGLVENIEVVAPSRPPARTEAAVSRTWR